MFIVQQSSVYNYKIVEKSLMYSANVSYLGDGCN